ncbi:unnamed protein product [Didymodactylos carnosus]|uniref:Uncharacterized protein n=1 Tax=Didymodactylos carnosus TaxID=1234261 RepID=A0A813NSH9_9BILA|nr:unnamed protein product [Didymodactylos carnosus]CAF3518128.1 unnamed protein product [Didymodactylos carnosus]
MPHNTGVGVSGTGLGGSSGAFNNPPSTVTDRTISLQSIQSGNNDSTASITWNYPNSVVYDFLSLTFNVYQFENGSFDQPSLSQTYSYNLTNSNTTVTSMSFDELVPGNYIIACVIALQYYQVYNTTAATSTQCSVGQTTLNLTKLQQLSFTAFPTVSVTQISVTLFWPNELPYDKLTMNAMLNNKISSTYSTSSNDTYEIRTYSFSGLTPRTTYSVCAWVNYSNSYINKEFPGVLGGSPMICGSYSTYAPLGSVKQTRGSLLLTITMIVIIAILLN